MNIIRIILPNVHEKFGDMWIVDFKDVQYSLRLRHGTRHDDTSAPPKHAAACLG